MKFGIAVILYNPDEEVAERLHQYAQIVNHVLLVDNSEVKNQTVQQIIANDATFHYFDMGGNYGMSEALNKIFRQSADLKLDYILTMDQDSYFPTKEIHQLFAFVETHQAEKAAIYCPNYCKLYWNQKQGMYTRGKLAIAETDIKETLFSMTSGSCIDVKIVQEVTPLSDLFIGYVDNELCYKLYAKGYKILMLGNICFEQRVGNPVKATLYNRVLHILHHSEIRYYYMARNNLFLQKAFKENSSVRSALQVNFWRIIVNILLGEKKKMRKLTACRLGMKDCRQQVMGKVTPSLERKLTE